MPRKYYPDTDPAEEPIWIVLDKLNIIVKISAALAIQGRQVVTQYLQEQGYAVQAAEDEWHISLSMPEEP